MKQFIVLVAILACAFAAPGYVAPVHHVVHAAPAVAVASVVPVATSYQKVDRVHNNAVLKTTEVVAAVQPVVHAAPVVATHVVKAAPVVHAAPVAVHAAPVVHQSYVHAAPVAVHAAPVVHQSYVHAAPVVAAPALVKSHVVAPAVHAW